MLKKIVRMFLSLLLVTAIGVGGYAWTIYNQSTDALSHTYKGFGNETNVIAETKPLTVLLMGVDTGSGSRSDTWKGNSDSMLLLSVNPQTKKTVMMSLERDILTQIDEKGETTEAKLNAAYAYGGAELAIATIEKLMNIHIDRYVMINMQGLVQLVDAVGGIEVNNTFDFPISIEENEPEYTATVEPGKHLINGDQALVYARMRYQDPEGDYGRQKRQREVIRKVVEKVLSLNSISHYQAILRAVSKNMQTNVALDAGSIPQLLGYKDAFRSIQSEQLRGEDATLADGGSYQLVTSDHLLEMQNLIRKTLGLSSVKTLKTNAVLYEDLMGGRSLRSSNSSSSTTYQHDEQPIYNQPTESNYGGANYSSSTPTPPEPSASSEPPASSAPASTPAPTPSASSADHPATSASSE